MSTQLDELPLLKPGLLGKWIAERFDIWQMRFLSDSELGHLVSNLGLMPLSLGDHIKLLWQLGLLRADLVISTQQLNIENLILVDQDDSGNYYYADERDPIQQDEGLGSTIAELPKFPSYVKLRFHPFRYYVLYHVDGVLRLRIQPMQMLISIDRYPEVLKRQISAFQEWSASPDFRHTINRWNSITSLAVAAEPYTYERLFNIFKGTAFSSEEQQRQLILQHWAEFKSALQDIGIENVEKVRRDLCIDAETLDQNKNVHVILRFTEGETRLRKTKGRLGGAIYLLTMAEMLRRSAEEVFSVELPEEDELGFGMAPVGIKERLYGSSRILDNNRSARNEFLREFGLDYGVRVRWYVEGDTEYNALDSILGRYAAIDLINLRGNVVAKVGKGVAFRDSLRSDLRSGIFSFVSIDGDRGDYWRAVRAAAQNDEICGMFFISDPDFEFANFTTDELSEILWELAVENGANPDDQKKLFEATTNSTSGNELFNAAKKTVSALKQVDKGRIWGERLMVFAWNNPEMVVAKDKTTRTRPIVDAITFALRAVHADYLWTRTYYRVDPATGESVERES